MLFAFLLFINSWFYYPQSEITELRELLYKGSENEKYAARLFEKVGKYNGSNALLTGYKGAALALKAKHAFNPVSKLQNVNKALEYLTKAVTQAPGNLEVRFLRYSVESQIPALLNLSEHVKEDQAVLIKGLQQFPASNFDLATARITRDYLLLHCTCKAKEKEFLTKLEL